MSRGGREGEGRQFLQSVPHMVLATGVQDIQVRPEVSPGAGQGSREQVLRATGRASSAGPRHWGAGGPGPGWGGSPCPLPSGPPGPGPWGRGREKPQLSPGLLLQPLGSAPAAAGSRWEPLGAGWTTRGGRGSTIGRPNQASRQTTRGQRYHSKDPMGAIQQIPC